ncbi:hypothetical protein CGLO_09997 [Colletotrichum gloeosporioides Cg-14]|uniref:Uncharacterized protein n=1 Tax=Colletotrichum gloeosporioides (strain Cg-14) TaxID=1237896 RepID=T0LQR8_COLGC|nr:hypothetical protein CGLO_09997 [Colletotrichum gloeosporioides Cg-14]
MSNYKLTLLIDNAIFAAHPTDKFCIAKKVNGSFTTVFQDASIQPKRADQQQLHAQNDFE